LQTGLALLETKVLAGDAPLIQQRNRGMTLKVASPRKSSLQFGLEHVVVAAAVSTTTRIQQPGFITK